MQHFGSWKFSKQQQTTASPKLIPLTWATAKIEIVGKGLFVDSVAGEIASPRSALSGPCFHALQGGILNDGHTV